MRVCLSRKFTKKTYACHIYFQDSHNTILDFDENTSLFAVYDGHGGAEVATYCSQNLPNFIKNTEAYKSGDMVKALTDAFLGFDASIATKEVMDILKELAGKRLDIRHFIDNINYNLFISK